MHVHPEDEASIKKQGRADEQQGVDPIEQAAVTGHADQEVTTEI